ncbi:hypothetical protein [Providencia sp. Je.9.19]|uniref:hypothetical protein n=1 Tax=Providencia sp. Je.9.19 TaxID=3142844 RepID=UPI003DAA0631
MKGRIKFNDAMLAAVMDGRKTQTRRPIEPQPKVTEEELRKLGAWQEGYTLSEQVCAAWRHGFVDVDCPYGEIGDIISVTDKDGDIKGKIEITDVCIEQLNHISEEDAKAEGILMLDNNFGNGTAYCDYTLADLYDTAEWFNRASDSFISLWQSIYGAEIWLNNPWVWVIEFKKVE